MLLVSSRADTGILNCSWFTLSMAAMSYAGEEERGDRGRIDHVAHLPVVPHPVVRRLIHHWDLCPRWSYPAEIDVVTIGADDLPLVLSARTHVLVVIHCAGTPRRHQPG